MNSTADSSAPSNGLPALLILAGTTASGKTDVSIPLALRLNGEILSADSRQIFRELSIGTAKPSPEQLATVRHHFIDEKSIRERWTAGDFAREARARIEQIIRCDLTPIVVGGSMLYLRALMDGFYREEDERIFDYGDLRREMETLGLDALYAELKERDPELAARTHPSDHHRILRGLAVCRGRGIRLSTLQERPRESLRYPCRLYFLHADRQETYERVNRRVIAMLDAGLVEEVRALMEQGFREDNCNALRTHGYQEVFPYVRGEISYERMIEEIQQAVRHYVKRQHIWFRRDPRTVWIRRDFAEPARDVAERIAEDFRQFASTLDR